MMVRGRLVLGALAAVLSALEAAAAPPRPTPTPAGRSVDLQVGETRDLPFPATAETIDVASPGVVDLFMRDPRTLSLFGKADGATSLTIRYADGRSETVAAVVHAATETAGEVLARRLREALAGVPEVRVRPEGEKVVLSGKTSGDNRPVVDRLAEVFHDSVVNDVKYTSPPPLPRVTRSEVPAFTNVDTPDGSIERVEALPVPRPDDTAGEPPRGE